MPNNDSAFKRLMEAFPAQLTKHFGYGGRFVRARNIELSREPMRIDALLEMHRARKRQHELLHLEVQTKHDAFLAQRLCTYDLLIWQREGLPVHTRVIYLERCKTITSPWSPWEQKGNTSGIIYHFDVVRLWEEPVGPWLAATDAPGIMPFVPLLQGATPAMLPRAIDIIQQVKEPAAREDTLNYLFMFAARTFGRRTLLDYLRRNPLMEEYIQASPWYQEILRRGAEKGKAEGRTEGHTEGEVKGRTEGEVKGRIEGQAEMLKGIWEERFGPMPEDIQQAVLSGSPAITQVLIRMLAKPDATVMQIRQMLPKE